MMIKSENISFPIAEIFSAILFLFFIQQITFLVESIYMLNLLNTQMDIRAAGISFLFLPGLLLALKHSKPTYLLLISLMLICMLLSPMLSSPWRIFSAGIGAGLFLTYLGLQLSDGNFPKVNWGQSAALATMLSILFRIAGSTLDVSVTGNTIFISWVLVVITAVLAFFYFKNLDAGKEIVSGDEVGEKKSTSRLVRYASVRGLAGTFVLIYFAFSSPGVIVRWVEGNFEVTYLLLLVSILLIIFLRSKKIILDARKTLILIIWNVLFLCAMTLNIFIHRVDFPSLEKLEPVIIIGGTNPFSILNYIMLMLSPIIFINISVFSQSIKVTIPSKLAFPFLRGVGLIIVCIFILIFTNTWGYVGAVSKIFRNQFYLPFLIAGFLMIVPYLFPVLPKGVKPLVFQSEKLMKIIASFVVALSIVFIMSELNKGVASNTENVNELTLMTYNIQQGVDLYGNKNFEGQLEMIKEVNPDIVCLQESDASRISGGNSDVVRYFSQKLGYHSYYGPKTVTGTYGTAILSRFPLDNTKTIFTYSSKDEIGTAFADIMVGNRKIRIVNSHPAGNERSREEHINMVISEAQQPDYVIAMGDYNFRQDSPYYKKIASELKDSWLSLYPDAIGAVEAKNLDLSIQDRKTSSGRLTEDGMIDMKSRIDHIFLSHDFEVTKARYLPAPESETDHPLYWAVVTW